MTTSNKNIHASNNRFSNLLEKNNNNNNTKNNVKTPVIQKQTNIDNNEIKKSNLNVFKSDREEIKQNNILMGRRRYEDRIKDEQMRRSLLIEEKMRKSKEDEIKMLTNVDSFPELKPVKVSVKNNVVLDPIKKNMELNYVSKIINNNQDCLENESSLNDNNNDYVKPGWVCIKTDKITNQLVWSYGEDTLNNNNNDGDGGGDDDDDDDEDPYVVFSRLTEMWDNRRMDYIKKWGIADYERNFMLEYIDV
jgi:hypothetical protein